MIGGALDSMPQAPRSSGAEMYRLIQRLYPICRSITGEGVRATLRILGDTIPLSIEEIPTGTKVFDWEVPREWNIRDAHVSDLEGHRIIDFRKSNLHVVNYSVPVHSRLRLEDLKAHLYVHPENADWIPYRTTYYNESWGFCLSRKQLDALKEAEYEVVIDSSLEPGSLTYGECVIPGVLSEEVLFFTHTCHPSLCNDNLSGLAVMSHLAAYLRRKKRRYTYRFVFAPGTIGSITWLSRNQERLQRIAHGLVVALVGDSGGFTYKKTHDGATRIDKIVEHVLRQGAIHYDIIEFSPYGYDERQFASPGIRLPVGRFTRTPNGEYPEYHSSADDLALVTAESLQSSLEALVRIVDVLEKDRIFVNTSPKGEPQLGRRGLYRKMGGHSDPGRLEMALLWVLCEADGTKRLLDIADRAKTPFWVIAEAAEQLLSCGLLRPAEPSNEDARERRL
jgi:aminopeptidase-like protein